MDALVDQLHNNPIVFTFVAIGALLLILLLFGGDQIARSKRIVDFPRKFPQDEKKDEGRAYYDVAIVGAGPSGATCGYYLGKAGRNVLLLEKKTFPRDKYCGDAVVKTGVEILQDMGVFQQLLAEKKAKISDSGGLVSPSGLSYIGASHEHLGDVPAAVACKRIDLDNAVAMAAKQAGADLRENSAVSQAEFDADEGLWTVHIDGSDVSYKARVIVCADGAPSKLATQLGIVKRPPDGTCSRAYVEAGTHNLGCDGIVFYPRKLLPGYAALFKHATGEVNYCVYLIPGNPAVTMDDQAYWHEHLKTEDPYMSKALGENIKIERMKAASLRLGGEPVSYDRHVLVVGDAAGMIDPMTGEGIHHAMDGGKLAARFLDETLTHGNYDRDVMKIYHQRWMQRFGNDFKWSMRFCQTLFRFPILLDAATAALARKGDTFLAKWADIMTGRVPKVHMLKPEFSITITYELIRLMMRKMVGLPINPKKSE